MFLFPRANFMSSSKAMPHPFTSLPCHLSYGPCTSLSRSVTSKFMTKMEVAQESPPVD